MGLNNFQISKNFCLKEFSCKCCDQVKIGSDLVGLLQKLRNLYGKPLNIISGYRCVKHNSEVGGADNSYHTLGRALDIQPNNNSIDELKQLCKIADSLGFQGIGIYPDEMFVHLDNGDRKAYWKKYSGKNYQYFTSLQEII